MPHRPPSDHDRPLLAAAAERDAEAHARCCTAERACQAIGLSAGCTAERLLVLIAKIAGHDTYTRTAAQIAGDRDIPVGDNAAGQKSVRRAIRQLRDLDLLDATTAPVPHWRRVGKPPELWTLAVRWDELRRLVALDTAWRTQLAAGITPDATTNLPGSPLPAAGRGAGGEGPSVAPDSPIAADIPAVAAPQKSPSNAPAPASVELGTTQGHSRDKAGKTEGQPREKGGKTEGHLPDPSSIYPYPHIPGPQPQGMPAPASHSHPPAPPRPVGHADHGCLDSRPVAAPATATRPVVTPDQIAHTAGRLFAAIRYAGDDGRALWHIAAAYDADLIPESAIGDAAQATRLCATRSPVGYFRAVLAEHLGLDADGLRALLARVAIRGPVPTSRPPRVAAASQAPNRPPREATQSIDAAANEARNRIHAALQVCP